VVPFVELQSQFRALEREVRAAIDRVLERSWYVLGEECAAFEREFADWAGTEHAVGLGSGTEAIHLALRAVGVGHGDQVITVANTCVPTISAIAASGATPVLVDAHPETLTLDPERLSSALTAKTRAIVPVHLYGHPCDMDPIMNFAATHDLAVVEDCAQAHGARYKGRTCGTLGHLAAFSFYPSKNLGAYGDAGAVTTNDPALDAALRKLRNYGEETRYHHVAPGFNSRLDELQAAILRVKLPYVEMWNGRRQALAARYAEGLAGLPIELPPQAEWAQSNHHLYPIRTSARDALQGLLRKRGVTTLMHYPVPVHLQPAYASLGYKSGDFPVAEASCATVLSLPLYPELDQEAQDEVVQGIHSFFA
jgi:dTDP-4-amino-4,6-dideoxygalactose transaminase